MGYFVYIPATTTLRKGDKQSEVKELGRSVIYASTMNNIVNLNGEEVPDQRRHTIMCVMLTGR